MHSIRDGCAGKLQKVKNTKHKQLLIKENLDLMNNEKTGNKENIVLIGMSGSGKTSVGQALSGMTGLAFVDTDSEIEKSSGIRIPEIFRTRGEAHFRDLEEQTIHEISKRTGCVISTGGGAVLREANIRELRKHGIIVFLKREVETILPDVNRPLADTVEKIERLYRERLPLYEKAADLVLSVKETVQETAEELLQRIREYGLSEENE